MQDPLDKRRRPTGRADRVRDAAPRAVDPEAPNDFAEPDLPAADVNALFEQPDLPLFDLPAPKRQKTRTRQRRVIDSKFADPLPDASAPKQLWATYKQAPATADAPEGFELTTQARSQTDAARVYNVHLRTTTDGRELLASCDCPAFIHRKTCRHITAARAEIALWQKLDKGSPKERAIGIGHKGYDPEGPRFTDAPQPRAAPQPKPPSKPPLYARAPYHGPPTPTAQQIQDEVHARLLQAALRHEQRHDVLRFVCGRYPAYQPGWVHREVCDALNLLVNEAERGEGMVLQINLPFRHGKSELAAINLPAFYLGRRPRARIILASYAQSLANKFSRQSRAIINSPYFQDLFPDCRISRERKAVQEWETTQGGGLKAVGVGGGVTGHGADLIIVDDVYKGFEQADSIKYREKIEEWWKTELGTREMPGASILVLNTRWNEMDFNAFISADARANNRRLIEISYPAIAEEDEPHRKAGEALHPIRYPLHKLQQWQVSMGPYRWRALGQQRPVPPGGQIFQRSWWRYWTSRQGPIFEPSPAVQGQPQNHTLRPCEKLDPDDFDTIFDTVCLSVDCTFKDTSDGSMVAFLVAGRKGNKGYLLDAHWERLSFVETCQKIQHFRRLWQPTHILVEDKANGPAVMSALRAEVPNFIPIEPQGSKEARAHACSGVVEAGHVYLPHPDDSPHNKWVPEFVRLMSGFPKLKPDDPVDAFTQWAVREIVRVFTYRVGGASLTPDAGLTSSLTPASEPQRPEWSFTSGFLPGW